MTKTILTEEELQEAAKAEVRDFREYIEDITPEKDVGSPSSGQSSQPEPDPSD